MKNIIVTGGCGFLGSHLVDALLDEGHKVLVIDNMQTGREKNLAAAKAKHGDKLQVWNKDITLIVDSEYARLLRKGSWSWDAVFNFACPASPPAYQLDPVHTMMTCVVGTKNMLDIAKHNNAIFVQASTSEIYGDPEVHPQVETYRGCVNTLGPRACYDEGKRAAETLCMDYQRRHGLRVKLGRIFNTYGPRMDPNDGRVVSNFVCQALRGEKITVYGDGTQTRSFCYVSDLIDGFMRLAKSPDDFHGPVNLGNPRECTMNDLVQHVVYQKTGAYIRGSDLSSYVTYHPLPQDDPKQRCPDITLARERLGWEPKVTLFRGLLGTVRYFREELGL